MCGVALSLGVPTAHADEDQAAEPPPQVHDPATEAAKLTEQGTRAWERGEHDVALEYFRLAHKVYPSPKFHYNIGLALSGLGRTLEAVEAFETFLRLAPDAPADTRSYAAARIVALDKKLGRIAVETNVAAATATIDGNAVPLDTSIRVAPGPHVVSVASEGHVPRELTVDVAAGTATVQRVHLREVSVPPPESAAAPAEEQPPERTIPLVPEVPRNDGDGRDRGVMTRWWFWTAVGVAVVGTATTVALLSRDGGGGCPSTDLGCIELP